MIQRFRIAESRHIGRRAATGMVACSTFHPPTASTITTSAAAIHRPLFTSHSLAGHQ